MRVDPVSLHGREFDVLVVGGGIQGAALAREAALRGMTTLLVEREDFACGTSMRSSRLIHGGVRYLQQGHLSLVREALAERERLFRLAPHLVRPLPMLMPFFRDGGGTHRWLVRAGLRAYSLLARGSTLPAPRYHSAADCIRMFPGLRTTGLHGGSLFYDGRTEDLRLTLAVLLAAFEAGAELCNHAELAGLRGDGAIVIRDTLRSDEVEVRAAHVINAAGPSVDRVRRVLGIDAAPLIRLSRGSHLVLPPREGELSLGAFLPDGRIQFVVPHPDGTLCGTTDVETDASEGAPPREDVDYLLRALAHLLDPAPSESDVRFGYAGWRALPATSGPPGALNREAFTKVEALPGSQLHTVVGGKLTTHRSFAERTIAALTGRTEPSPSRTNALPGGAGPHDIGDPLWWRHGSRASEVRALAGDRPELLQPVAPDRPELLRVEAVHALRELGAVTFTDLMLRRLFHTQGPSLDETSMRAMHELYLRERRVNLDRSYEQDRDELLAEVTRLRGGVGSGSESQSFDRSGVP